MSDQFQFSKIPWEVLKDKKVYGTPIFSLHEISLKPEHQKSTHPFYVLKAPEWINVIGLTPQKKIVLVEQYRAGIQQPTLEIPGGMVDSGESPDEAARREFLEETGYSSTEWEYLGKTSSNPAILSNYTHLYLARNCEKTEPAMQDGSEDIKQHVLPFEQFLELVKNGTIHHSIVLAAVSKYLLYIRGN